MGDSHGGGKKKKRQFHEEHEEHANHDEPWLVSYADMMTLLFGFFVVMYSFASKEKAGEWEKVRRDLSKHFGQEYITPFEDISEEIIKAVENTPLAEQIDQMVTPEGIEITFRSSVLFEVGREYIAPQALPTVEKLVQIILTKRDQLSMIVEGHTDDSPISTERFPSNWELSAARATTVLRLFESRGFHRTRMQAVAYGDTRPIVQNRNENGDPIPTNQALNRRVVLKINTSMKKTEEKPVDPSSPGASAAAPAQPSNAPPEGITPPPGNKEIDDSPPD
jgi:chemotaxis protein MotB